jgi:hypothetical protein
VLIKLVQNPTNQEGKFSYNTRYIWRTPKIYFQPIFVFSHQASNKWRLFLFAQYYDDIKKEGNTFSGEKTKQKKLTQ